ncbi:MAG: mannitol dehydrogenase [Ruminococcaceae bacterium]|nr:mannitol dehydrogenase [Oscillospiraceae bacterium]
MKKAVMYGGGNIGRGFIAQLFNLSGYEVVFIDVVDALVEKVNNDKEYPIYITNGDSYDKYTVTNVRAVNGKDENAVAEEIATADVMATAVGVNILKFIAKPLAAGVEKRASINGKPLNIIICENKIDADKYLRSLVNEHLTEAGKKYFEEQVGLVEASIGRMVPATPDNIKAENFLAVCVEPYCTLPVDKNGFKGEIPEIKNMEPFAPFEFFIQRKLFMHNMSHAVTAYLGNLCGYEYIWEAIDDARIRYVALRALLESALAMHKEHGVDIADLLDHCYDLLNRFTNKLLGDTIARVGRDTQRKLNKEDRIVGALNLCKKNGVDAKYLYVAVAAGLRFAPEGDDSSIEIANYTKENGVKATLAKYCEITDEKDVACISEWYDKLANGIDCVK